MMLKQTKLSCAFAPNVVYTADYVAQSGYSQMVRFQIVALEEGGFEVQTVDTTKHTIHNPYQKNGTFSKLSLAKSKVQEEGLAIEQNGFDFYEDNDYSLYDCTVDAVHVGNCTPEDSFAFHALHHDSKDLIVQPLSGGFHGVMTINQYGHIHLAALGCHNRTRMNDCSEARQVKCLTAVTGFRGAILEVIIANREVKVLDAAYFADRWLDDMPFSQRVSFVLNKLVSHGIDTNIFIQPRIVDSMELLKLNSEGIVKGYMARKAGAKPVVSRIAEPTIAPSQWVVVAGQGASVKLVTAIRDKTNVLCGDTLQFLYELDLPAYVCQVYRDVMFLAQCSNQNRMPIVLNC